MTERRQEPRVATVLDAVWGGHSGGGPCRVTDISWRGCFVQSVFGPVAGNETSVTVTLGNTSVGFRGRVPYVEDRMGFAVMFDELTADQQRALSSVLGGR